MSDRNSERVRRRDRENRDTETDRQKVGDKETGRQSVRKTTRQR
jgi:hypothetical protein